MARLCLEHSGVPHALKKKCPSKLKYFLGPRPSSFLCFSSFPNLNLKPFEDTPHPGILPQLAIRVGAPGIESVVLA